jgi:hypothetical protein
VLRNQLIELPSAREAEGTLAAGSIYEGQYSESIVSQDELWATLFFSAAASNSSLFWRLDRNIQLSTARLTDDPAFQERLRTLCIDRPVYVAMEPKVVWRNNGPETLRAKLSGWSWHLSHVRSVCRLRGLHVQLYRHLRERGALDKLWHNRFRELDAGCERVLWKAGIMPPTASRLSRTDRAALLAKGLLARMLGVLVAEPVKYRIGKVRVEEA